MTTLDDLWEFPPDAEVPWLDRKGALALSEFEEAWRSQGVLVLPRFVPEDLLDAYVRAYRGGWGIGTPYVEEPTIRDLCLYGPLRMILGGLIGEEMGLHLNLTWWRSTERAWHQDDYLNPPFVNAHYAAVWFALDDIHPDSGPFEYVPGSHRWPVLRRHKVLEALNENGDDPDWPWRSEKLLEPLFEEKIEAEGHPVVSFLAKKGDVLVWHGRLLHRGSRPRVPGMERRGLIAHYSGIPHRLDMAGHWLEHPSGGRYFAP